MNNPVKEAVEILGGTLEDVAVVARVTSAGVCRWVKKGRIPYARHAILVAQACAAAGHPEVTLHRLAGLNGEGEARVAKAG